MGIESNIEWTDHTWNPWQGCTKVSPACQNCYMFTDMKRYGKDPAHVRRSAPATFNLPLKRTGKKAIEPGSKVFTCSWSDWFHKDADAWRNEAWEVIRQRPDVIFQIVTKRTERIAECLPSDWGNGWPNVWLIATVENQEWADVRIPQLLEIPAAVRGLSMEPLLGEVSLEAIGRNADGWPALNALTGEKRAYRGSGTVLTSGPRIHWVIAGGESGPKSRPMHPRWVRSIRDQSLDAGVAFFFKQWGEWRPPLPREEFSTAFGLSGKPPAYLVSPTDGTVHCFLPADDNSVVASDSPYKPMIKVGKHKAGRLLDGQEWSQFPVVNV